MIRVMASARGVWIISMAVLDTGASSKIIKEEFVMAA